jgi:hypothetical protein
MNTVKESPFEIALKKYLDIFRGQEMCFINDNRNLELFAKNPSNQTEEDIRTKISAISDDLEVKQLSNRDDLINHILKLNIDDRLTKGDLSLVEDIAHVKINGTVHNLLHFSSLYCNLHKPDVFPIYSDQHHDFYRKYIKHFNLSIDAEKLTTYPVFAAALDDLLTRTGVKGKMNYIHLRKFGWLYADKVLKEAGI